MTLIPETVNAPVSAIETRPKWFQPRDTPGGIDYDPEKVGQIVRHFDPERFEALWAVRDPARPGGYIIIAGHHRLQAARELKLESVPIRILGGDASSEADRRRLTHKADVSNYLVSNPGLIEQVNTVRRMHGEGYSDRDVSDVIRKRPSEIEKLRYLAAMPPDTLRYVSVNKEMRGIAETLGEARVKGWVDDEAASHLYKRAQDLFEETRKVPSKNAFRQQLIDAHEKAQFRAAQPGRLAGFGENLLVAQVLADAAAETRRQKELADTTRRLTSCQQLADDLDVSIDQVREAAQSKLDALDLTPTEVARARQVLARDTTPGATPAERELERIVSEAEAGQGTAGVGLNLFGEVQAIPQEVEPEKHWLDPDYLGPLPVVTAQTTMGAGFDTNRSLAMPVGEGRAAAAPLADSSQLQAARERRGLLAQGQKDMLVPPPVPKPEDGPSILNTGREIVYRGQPIGEEIVTFQQPSGPEARAYFTARHRTGTTGRFGTLEDAQRFIRMRNPPQGRPSVPPAPEPAFRQDPDPEPINITINVIDGDNRANPAARRLVQPDGSTGSIKSCPPRQAKPEKPKPLRPRSRPPAVKARTPSGGRSAGRNETPVAGHPLALIARVGRRKHGVK